MNASSTPQDVTIARRDIVFDLEADLATLWHGGDAFRTAFFNALSLQFPDGERFFIESVRAYRERIDDPRLRREIVGFIGQEAMHGREHRRFNAALKARGYAVERMEGRLKRHLGLLSRRVHPALRLAGTCAAEHYTAVLADGLLRNPQWLEGAPEPLQNLWFWHAIEESEHKGVAFDVFQHCIGNQRMRRLIFLSTTLDFFRFTFANTCSMLRSEGKLWSLRTWLGGLRFLWGRGGPLRVCLPAFLAYLRRDFHPWQFDNRAELGRWRERLEAMTRQPLEVDAGNPAA